MYTIINRPISGEMKMADVILGNPYFILMLEHFGISMAVQEKKVSEICQENNVSLDVFLVFANLYNGVDYTPEEKYTFSDITTIINYLKNCHSYYLEEKCPAIHQLIIQMFELNDLTEIRLVEKFFQQYIREITQHINYENMKVFPYIKELYRRASTQPEVNWDSDYSVTEYKEQHDDIEEKLTDIKNLLIKYLPQKNDQVIRRKLLFSLFELEHDLNIHSQIEDHILIPLVQQLEERRKGEN